MKTDEKKKKRFPKLSARRYTQLIAAVLYNCNVKGFAEGKIFKGASKGLCVPGLNCYSCPGGRLPAWQPSERAALFAL